MMNPFLGKPVIGQMNNVFEADLPGVRQIGQHAQYGLHSCGFSGLHSRTPK
jgi:hypothetical protein